MFKCLFSLRIFYLQKLCSWVYWHEMHYLCRGYVYMNYFSVCDTKFKWLKKCLFNFFECFPFLSVPSLDFSLFFMHKKTNLFLIHLVCRNLFQLPFAQPTVLSFVHDIISLAQHKYLVCRTYSWTSVSRISISCGYVICKSQSHLFKDTKVLLYYLICTIFSHSHNIPLLSH